MSFDYCEWEKGGCFKHLCLYIIAHPNYIKRTLQLFQEIHSSGWNTPYVLDTSTQQGALRWLLGRLPVMPGHWRTYGAFHPWLTSPSFLSLFPAVTWTTTECCSPAKGKWVFINNSPPRPHTQTHKLLLAQSDFSLCNILYLAMHTHDSSMWEQVKRITMTILL